MSSTVLFSFRSWWPIFLALLFVSGQLSASAEGDCFTSDGKEVKLTAKCTKANTTIKVSNKEKVLDFKLDASKAQDTRVKTITLNVGGCEIKGTVSYGGDRNTFQLDSPVPPSNYPARAKATSSGVTFSNPTYSVPSCTPKFVADGDGYLVNISYTADVELPNLQITFSDSQLYVPPEEADWSTGGWRLWAVIAAVVAIALSITAGTMFFVLKQCKNKNQKADGEKDSNMINSTSIMKKDDAKN